MSDAAHPHPPHLAHHFDSMEQQHASMKLGMWLFLTTELLLFSGLFVAYTAYRSLHPEVFHHASKLLDVQLGALNTAVLILSSLTMALAVRAAQVSDTRRLIRHLVITVALAGVFLVVKFFEYEHKFHLGIGPGEMFTPKITEYVDLPYTRNFFSIYFVMTGLHGLHVIAGMIAIGVIIFYVKAGKYSAENYAPVECVGLYWHLVDLVWIYLFPLLYLIH